MDVQQLGNWGLFSRRISAHITGQKISLVFGTMLMAHRGPQLQNGRRGHFSASSHWEAGSAPVPAHCSDPTATSSITSRARRQHSVTRAPPPHASSKEKVLPSSFSGYESIIKTGCSSIMSSGHQSVSIPKSTTTNKSNLQDSDRPSAVRARWVLTEPLKPERNLQGLFLYYHFSSRTNSEFNV